MLVAKIIGWKGKSLIGRKENTDNGNIERVIIKIYCK
jgi:hypothetical protein